MKEELMKKVRKLAYQMDLSIFIQFLNIDSEIKFIANSHIVII